MPLLAPMLVLAFALPAQALESCPEGPERSVQELSDGLDGALDAYAAADVDAFLERTNELNAMLPCLAEPISRDVAAAAHRIRGMRAFIDRQPVVARNAFSAARALEPAYSFPTSLVPEGHPLAKAYAHAPEAPTTDPVEPARSGHLRFDGRRSNDRPTSRNTVAQLLDREGGVTRTAYLLPAEPMFPYEPGRPDSGASGDGSGMGLSVPLAIGAGAAAVLASVSYGLAGASYAEYGNDPYLEHKDGLRGRTNALVGLSAGLGGAALGAGIGAVVVGQW